MTIERFVLVDKDDQSDEQVYEHLQDAIDAAGDDHAVVARQFEYTDSELVWTPNGANIWPPKKTRGR